MLYPMLTRSQFLYVIVWCLPALVHRIKLRVGCFFRLGMDSIIFLAVALLLVAHGTCMVVKACHFMLFASSAVILETDGVACCCPGYERDPDSIVFCIY